MAFLQSRPLLLLLLIVLGIMGQGVYSRPSHKDRRDDESRPDWNNVTVVHRGVLPYRAYFFPYDDEKSAATYTKTPSPNMLDLSGTWKFNFVRTPGDAPVETSNTSGWDEIPVPSMWNLHGYHYPQYLNIRYPFREDCPNIQSDENHVGSYQRTFKIPDALKSQQIRLRFEGVDSAYHVWVNGKQVGYHQGARNPAEYDITSVVNLDGDNTIFVRVYRWSVGSYVEDQDQWRMSGIFRQVLLVGFHKDNRIENYVIAPKLDSSYKNAIVHVNITTKGAGTIGFKLLDADQEIVSTQEHDFSAAPDSDKVTTSFSVAVKAPKKWTAETPHLYTVVLDLNGETYIGQRIGFKKVELRDKDILVNGKRVIFLGANRHEHHPEHGRAVPLEFAKRDLLLMKQHNLNAIRTSHYIDDPRFYDFIDELGLYLMDECDEESHGIDGKGPWKPPPGWVDGPFPVYDDAKFLADNPNWTGIMVDRAMNLIHRDVNHVAVTIWSLGNEAQIGRNHLYMANYIRDNDPLGRPIQYERDEHRYAVDIFSKMYDSPDSIRNLVKRYDRALIMQEYAHAMGNGPGGLIDYVDTFRTLPGVQGGFVWEWANHGILTTSPDGHKYYAYGGDFGDQPNDGTFVMDGLCNSDHTPTPGLIEYKQVIAPVEFNFTEGEFTVKIKNHNFFITTDYLKFDWRFLENGVDIKKGELKVSPIEPQATASVDIPVAVESLDKDSEYFLTVTARLASDNAWAKAGHIISSSQGLFKPAKAVFTLSREVSPAQSLPKAQAALSKSTALKTKTEGDTVTASSAVSVWSFNTSTGSLTWTANGSPILLPGSSRLGFYQPLTDNDERGPYRNNWRNARIHEYGDRTIVEKVDVNNTADATVITAQIAQEGEGLGFHSIHKYTLRGDSVTLHVKGYPAGPAWFESLARIGIDWVLAPGFEDVVYYGRGPGENYVDSKQANLIGRYTTTVDELWFDYEHPQENGNRMDIRWVQVKNEAKKTGIKVAFGEPFHFQAAHYHWKDIEGSPHPYQLRPKKKQETFLRTDWKHVGLGSASCGPAPFKQYLVPLEPYEFEITMKLV